MKPAIKNDSYAPSHRIHMAYEKEYQDREWRKLNERQDDLFWEILNVFGWGCALVAAILFATLAIYWWSK